jgi:hypothetical protein
MYNYKINLIYLCRIGHAKKILTKSSTHHFYQFTDKTTLYFWSRAACSEFTGF